MTGKTPSSTPAAGSRRCVRDGALPPDLTPEFLTLAARASWHTMAYAVAGITLAVMIGLPLGVIASGTVVDDSSRRRRPLVAAARLLLAGLRSVHELVWAVLLVAAIGLSQLAGIFALALPYSAFWAGYTPSCCKTFPNLRCGRCAPPEPRPCGS